MGRLRIAESTIDRSICCGIVEEERSFVGERAENPLRDSLSDSCGAIPPPAKLGTMTKQMQVAGTIVALELTLRSEIAR
jgi:hypothetical protein